MSLTSAFALFQGQLRAGCPFAPTGIVPEHVPVSQKVLQHEERLASLVAGAAVWITLAFMTGKRQQGALLVAAVAMTHWLVALPGSHSPEWPQAGQWVAKAFVHPFVTPGIFAVILVAAMGWALRRRWVYLLAAGGPVAYGVVRLIWGVRDRLAKWGESLCLAIVGVFEKRLVQGIALIVLAFLLLGAGALVQWRKQRR